MFCPLQEYVSVNHFLQRCTAFQQQRNTLRNNLLKLGVVDMSTNVLLGSSEHNIKIKISITYELATYIRATKRMEM